MVAIFRLVDVIASRNRLGECPLWRASEGALWWTDIQASRLHRYRPATGAWDSFATPERLCSFAFATDGGLIAAFASGLALFDPERESCRWLHKLHHAGDTTRSNDGRCDRDGRFWFGTMADPDGKPALGKLYRLDGDGALSVHGEGLGIPNALCTSLDGTRLYLADSLLGAIFVCDLDRGSGTLSNRRLFAQLEDGAEPDGAVVDAEDCLWNAHWDGGCIARYAPDGTEIARHALPVGRPTSLAFGGPAMNHLFVTTACEGLSKDAIIATPHAGNVLIYETDAAGVSDAEFFAPGA